MGFITAEMNLNSTFEKYDIIPDGNLIRKRLIDMYINMS